MTTAPAPISRIEATTPKHTITDRRSAVVPEVNYQTAAFPEPAPLGADADAQQLVVKFYRHRWGLSLDGSCPLGIEAINVRHLERWISRADRDKLAEVLPRLRKLQAEIETYHNSRARDEHKALQAKAGADPSGENLAQLAAFDRDAREIGLKKSKQALRAALKRLEDSEYFPILDTIRTKILPEMLKAILAQEGAEKAFSDGIGLRFDPLAPSRTLQCLRWTFAKLHLPGAVHELGQELKSTTPAK